MPVARSAGYRLDAAGEAGVELALPLRADFLQIEDRVHGGVLATLADTAAVYALYRGLPEDRSMTSVEFKLNFLRPVLLDGGEVRARAEVVQRGRTIGLCDVELRQAGRLVAKGLFTYLFAERRVGR